MATDIEPGATVSGIVSGYSARRARSAGVLARTASCAATGDWSGAFNRFHPIAQTTAPPATCTAGIDKPKKSSTYAPIKVDTSRSMKQLIATRRDNSVCASGDKSDVLAR